MIALCGVKITGGRIHFSQNIVEKSPYPLYLASLLPVGSMSSLLTTSYLIYENTITYHLFADLPAR